VALHCVAGWHYCVSGGRCRVFSTGTVALHCVAGWHYCVLGGRCRVISTGTVALHCVAGWHYCVLSDRCRVITAISAFCLFVGLLFVCVLCYIRHVSVAMTTHYICC